MKRSFIDIYSDIHSPIHNLDPRTKMICTVFFILTIVLTNPLYGINFLCYFLILAILIVIAKLSLVYVIKRTAIVIPFVLLVVVFIPFMTEGHVVGSYNMYFFNLAITKEGLLIAWNVTVKSCLSAMSLVVLSNTTPFSKLLKGLEKLGLPIIFVMILSFMYRYIFVLVDETLKMNNAMRARNVRLDHIKQLTVLGNVIGSLFLRTYERAERIYMVMIARGFDGHIRLIDDFHYSRNDFFYAAGVVGVIVAVNVWRYYV